MATLPIALIQTRTPASPAAAFAHVEPLIREAVAGGAKLILTPEATTFLIKDPAARAAALTTQDDDAVVAGLRDLARELGVWLLIGSAIVRSGHEGDDRAANRSILVDDRGEVVATYDKLHVYDVDLPTGERWRESAAIRPGDAAVVADTPWARLGLTICYDIRFPQLYRALARAAGSLIRKLVASGVRISFAPPAAASRISGATWARAAAGLAGVRVWIRAIGSVAIRPRAMRPARPAGQARAGRRSRRCVFRR